MNAAWGRALIPSLSDFFFVAVFVWLFVAGASGWKALLMDGDTGWHIRVGEYILDHRAVPTQDLFSFSRPSAPWFAWEWLTDVVYGALFRMAGLKAIVLLAGILIAVYATVLLRYAIWRGANTLLAAFMVLLSIGSASVHFLARPHLVTLLLVPVCFWMIEADRRENNRAIWLLIPITALWTNLHGGFLMLLACLAVLVVGSLLEVPFANGSPRTAARYAWLLAGCAAASLLNPYGTRLHTHIADYLRSDWIRNMVQEFQAPTFRSEGQVQFEILLLGGLIAAGFLLKRRKITEFLWLVFLGHSTIGERADGLVEELDRYAPPVIDHCDLLPAWPRSGYGFSQNDLLARLGGDRRSRDRRPAALARGVSNGGFSSRNGASKLRRHHRWARIDDRPMGGLFDLFLLPTREGVRRRPERLLWGVLRTGVPAPDARRSRLGKHPAALSIHSCTPAGGMAAFQSAKAKPCVESR